MSTILRDGLGGTAETLVVIPCGCRIVEEYDPKTNDKFLRLVGCEYHPHSQGPNSATRRLTDHLLTLGNLYEKARAFKDAELRKSAHSTTCDDCILDNDEMCETYDAFWLKTVLAMTDLWKAVDQVKSNPDQSADIPTIIRDILNAPVHHRFLGQEIRPEYLQNPNFMVELIRGICQDQIQKRPN